MDVMGVLRSEVSSDDRCGFENRRPEFPGPHRSGGGGSMTRRLPSLLTLVSLSISLVFGARFPVPRPAAARQCDTSRLYDDAAASTVLATKRPFAPANRDLFFSFDLADWADVAPIQLAKGPAPTEKETKEQLRTFLERRFPCTPQRVQDGLGVFADPIARQKIPDPTLRAALAALTGTFGEPAIHFLLYQAPVSTIHFGIVIFNREGFPQGSPATSHTLPDGTEAMVFDVRDRFNPFGTFSALLFHEALHVEYPRAVPADGDKPDRVGLPEEATAVALESLIYMQMLLTDPTLATLPDPQTRGGNNRLALARLNSGVAGTDRLNLFVPGSGVDIDPTTAAPVTEFYEYYAVTSHETARGPEWHDLETHGNALLAAALPALAESGHTPPAKPDFDRATLDFIDQNEAVLSPGQLIAVACILQLDVPCP
jgi:hypothetical protein